MYYITIYIDLNIMIQSLIFSILIHGMIFLGLILSYETNFASGKLFIDNNITSVFLIGY